MSQVHQALILWINGIKKILLMMTMRLIKFTLGILGLLPATAFADLPLTVEGLLSAQNRWRAELGINYVNLEQSGVSTGQSVAVQVAPAQFVYVPTQVGATRLMVELQCPHTKCEWNR